MKNLIYSISLSITLLTISFCSYGQTLSNIQKQDLIKSFDKHIKNIASISTDNTDMIAVYNYNMDKALTFLEENQRYCSDKDIKTKYLELKNLTSQNKELLDFLTPRVSNLYYTKAINLINQNKKQQAYIYLQKAIETKKDNIMALYELSKISLDSNQIVKTSSTLSQILLSMNPTEEEKALCHNLLTYTYDKNILESMSLIKQGKYAYAYDILTQLDDWCKTDKLDVCKKGIVRNNITICQKGIYENHIDITKKAINKGEMRIAGDFVKNTYDYFQRNRNGISDTTNFENLVQTVVKSYLQQAEQLTSARNTEQRSDLLIKAKELCQMVGGTYEAGIVQQIASIEGTTINVEGKLDSLEQLTANTGYSIDYKEYIQDSISNPEDSVKSIEKDYIVSSDNKQPSKSVATAVNQTKTIDKKVDDKFFETRQFMQVNNYEKVLEVLEQANTLAKVPGDKEEVAKMYKQAIREISAKRMSKAEYYIFSGEVAKADSLVSLTNSLIKSYDMEQDSEIQRIMNSYLRAIDNKVCQKKQEEINTIIVDILDAIQRNDFYTADNYITKAMQIKGNNECRLDKSRVRALKRQIEEPLQYVQKKEYTEDVLSDGDTMKYILEYSKLEYFYKIHKLSDLSVQHIDLREIITDWQDDNLAIRLTENLIKYRQYEGAIEAIGSLKNMGYKAKHTKKVQKRIGQLMALQEGKRQDKIDQQYRMEDRYTNDKWFKYFLKSFKKNTIKYNKIHN